jgi:multiple sugar transport system substrate-binding protein
MRQFDRTMTIINGQDSSPGMSALRQPARLLCVASVLFLLVVTLGGCDLPLATPQSISPTVEPTAGPQAEPSETAPPGVTPIVFWEPFALDRPQGLLLAEMIHDFQVENPDVAVEIVPWSGYTGIDGALLAQLPDGDLPDLAVAFPSMIAEYASFGVVVPLNPYLADVELGLSEEDLADIWDGSLEAGRLPSEGGQIMAFPFAQNAIGMWVNDTLLEQAGWDHVPATWAEFEQACFDVLAYTGSGCYSFVESVSTFDAWLYSQGGQSLDPSAQQVGFAGPAGVESLALLRRLIDAGLAWRPADLYGDYVAFGLGQAAFTFSSTGNSSLYLDAYQGALQNGLPPFRWHQAMIPQADPQRPATFLYGSSFFILRSDPFRQQAAWRLIRWFTDTPQTARWAGDLEVMPVRLSALEVMTDTLAAHPFVETQVQEIMPYARPEPASPAEFEIRDILYTAIVSVTQGTADPQTALDQAAREANAVLAGQR